MLKTISTKQVRLGMFIQELKGAWVTHPFWKTAFKLEDPTDLKKLQESTIEEVVINTKKGLDIAESYSPPEKKLASVNPETPLEIVPPPKLMRVSADVERQEAKKVISASKKAVVSMFSEARMGRAVNSEAAVQVVDDIAASVARNEGALISLLRLKNKDDYTYMHSVAVCAMMISLAKELNLSEFEIKQAGMAGLMHDLGKAAIPADVLNKPGALTEDEFSLIKLHPERGHALMLQAGITDELVLDVCLHHHEKISGTGYPHQLKADEITLFAKMGAVCDVYDAITSNRPYKDGWEPGVSLHRMAQWHEHFDDEVFKAFVKSIGIYPIGSVVELKSQRLAVVTDQNPTYLLTPIVKVFFSTKSKSRITIQTLDLSATNVQDSIIGPENPRAWGIKDINKIWNPE